MPTMDYYRYCNILDWENLDGLRGALSMKDENRPISFNFWSSLLVESEEEPSFGLFENKLSHQRRFGTIRKSSNSLAILAL